MCPLKSVLHSHLPLGCCNQIDTYAPTYFVCFYYLYGGTAVSIPVLIPSFHTFPSPTLHTPILSHCLFTLHSPESTASAHMLQLLHKASIRHRFVPIQDNTQANQTISPLVCSANNGICIHYKSSMFSAVTTAAHQPWLLVYQKIEELQSMLFGFVFRSRCLNHPSDALCNPMTT